MSRHSVKATPAWRVTIPAHTVKAVGGRTFEIPERVSEQLAAIEEVAIAVAVQWAHVDAGVPPLRSLLRQSRRLARAEPFTWVPGRNGS